ncbi:MAG: leucine-rich repeat domain-containing protein [Candidatus Sigynarchaeota archaeon]
MKKKIDYEGMKKLSGSNFTSTFKLRGQSIFAGMDAPLSLSHKEIASIAEIEGIQQANVVQEVYLNDNNISRIELLQGFKNLQFLTLAGNQIAKISGLETLQGLRVLVLARNNITRIEGMDRLINLKTLDLSQNKITKLEGLGTLNKLESLNLAGNPIAWPEGLSEKSPAQEIVAYCRKKAGFKPGQLTREEKRLKKIEEEGAITSALRARLDELVTLAGKQYSSGNLREALGNFQESMAVSKKLKMRAMQENLAGTIKEIKLKMKEKAP